MYYQIGDFSKICKISPRMLRYLDKEGILKPSEVLENGYRLYNDDDLYRAAEIMRLKHYRFTYSEISDLLEQGLAQDKKVLKKQLKRLMSEVEDTEALVKELERTLNAKPMHYNNLYEISVSYCKEKWQLTQEKFVTTAELDAYLEEMTQVIAALEVPLAGLYSLSFLQSNEQKATGEVDDTAEERVHIRWQQPITAFVQKEPFICLHQPACTVLSTKHYGSYETLFTAYQALYAYTMLNNYVLLGDFEEIYLLDASHTNIPNDFITELQVRVEKKD